MYSRSQINKRVRERTKLDISDTRMGPRRIELNDDALKRVTTCHAVVAQTDGQGFSPRGLARRRYPQRCPKRVTTPVGVAAIWCQNAKLPFRKTFSHDRH